MRNPTTLILVIAFVVVGLLMGLSFMESPIPCFIGFGVLCVLAPIATLIYNAAVSRSPSSAPWMRRIRRCQNQVENAGWRIPIIPCDDSSKPMTLSLKGWPMVLKVLGYYGFLAGMTWAICDRKNEGLRGATLAVLSLAVAALGIWLVNRGKRLEWDVAPARCVDRELGKIPVRGGWAWVWRIVCQYEYLGIPYRVTPQVYWASFPSEAAAHKFLEERISRQGECMLRVDPGNPLRAELLERGTKDQGLC